LAAEPMLGNLPDIGSDVGPYLPFGNAFRFIDVQWLYPDYAMPWGEPGSIVYFTAVVAAVFVAALVTVNRRDA
jgi:ABC-2 type transport system permease protein